VQPAPPVERVVGRVDLDRREADVRRRAVDELARQGI
jgi:hypothetical protein